MVVGVYYDQLYDTNIYNLDRIEKFAEQYKAEKKYDI